MIAIRTSGTAEVTVDGKPAPTELLWRKNLALLVYLARSPRLTRTREHLLGLLWSDRPESAARHSLNEALRIIRRSTGPDGVITDVDRVGLATGVVSLDVDRLDEADWDWSAAGEFLEGFAVPGATGFEEWLAGERRVWRGRMVGALCAAARGETDAGRSDAATMAAERAVRLDPESESAVAVLIECLARAGDRTAALACFQRFEALLAERYGSAPSAEMATLADRIRRSGGRGSRREPAPGSVDSRRRAPLVGREDAVEALTEAWNGVRAGRAALVVLEGDEGLGKSRLIGDFTSRAGIDGTVATVRMVGSDRDRADAAVIGWLKDALAAAPGVGGAAPGSLATAGKIDPAWQDRFATARTASPLPLQDALIEIVDCAEREAPVLLVIDDAQWTDPESFGLVERILRDLGRRRVMVLLATASLPARSELDGIRQRLGHDIPGRAIVLAPIGLTDLTALVRWRLPRYDPAAADRVARRLLADTAGYPLLAIDLLDAIAAGLDVGGDAPPWPNPAATLSQTRPGELPDTIVSAIRVGFRRLGPEAQTVLAAASLGPDRLDPDRLAEVVELPTVRVDGALDELEWARWLTADGQGYTFVARISREVVARDFLTGSQRRRCSARWLAIGA